MVASAQHSRVCGEPSDASGVPALHPHHTHAKAESSFRERRADRDNSAAVLPGRHSLRSVERTAAFGHLQQNRRWSEARTELCAVTLQLPNDFGRAHGVDMVQRAAAKRRKTKAENCADVAVTSTAQDPFPETVRGFVDHLQGAALGDFRSRKLGLSLHAEQRIDARVYRLLPHVLIPVQVKAALVLLSQPLIFQQAVHARRLSHTFAKRFVQDVAHLGSDVDPYFVQQSDRAYGKTPLDQSLIDTLDS